LHYFNTQASATHGGLSDRQNPALAFAAASLLPTVVSFSTLPIFDLLATLAVALTVIPSIRGSLNVVADRPEQAWQE